MAVNILIYLKGLYMYILCNKNSNKYSITTQFSIQFAILYLVYAIILGTAKWIVSVGFGDFLGALSGATTKITALGILSVLSFVYKTRLGLFTLLFQFGLGLCTFLVAGFGAEIYVDYVVILATISITFAFGLAFFLTEHLYNRFIPEKILLIILYYYLFCAIFIGYSI